MLKETAQVIDIKDNTLLVQTEVKTTCGSCQNKDNCATSSVAEAFSAKPNVINVEFDVDEFAGIKVGDMVQIGVAENFVVKSALYVYLLPIVGFMMFAFIAQMLSTAGVLTLDGQLGELITAIIAFAGGYAGYRVARWRLAKLNQCENQSVVLLAAPNEQIPIKVE